MLKIDFIPRPIRNFFTGKYLLLNNLLRYGTRDMFTGVDIENTPVCNLSCPECPNSIPGFTKKRGLKKMPTWLWKKAIDDLADMNYNMRISPVLYGEPFTDKRLPQLIKYAREKLPSARIHIFTNGTLATPEKAQELLESGVDSFTFNHTPKNMPPSILKRIICEPHTEDRKYYNRCGLIDIPRDKNIMFNAKSCNRPTDVLSITHKGDVILCCNDYFSEVVFGNIKEDSIYNIWKSEKFKKARKELRKGNFVFPICKKCVS